MHISVKFIALFYFIFGKFSKFYIFTFDTIIFVHYNAFRTNFYLRGCNTTKGGTYGY